MKRGEKLAVTGWKKAQTGMVGWHYGKIR